MSTNTILIAIEVYTDSSITDASIGIYNGVLRYITGKLNKADLLNEDGTPNAYSWYAGHIVKEGVSSPSREIDIREGGSYGKISNFSFQLTNHVKLWSVLRGNDIYLTGREVKVYAVVSNRLYQVWTGVVSNNPYTEIEYEFICEDAQSALHKDFPPNTTADGKTVVPVCLGEVPKAALLSTNEVGGPFALDTNPFNGAPIYKCSCISTTSTTYNTKTATQVVLRTWNPRTYDMGGNYLKCLSGTHEGRVLKILSSTWNPDSLTIIVEGDIIVPAGELEDTSHALDAEASLFSVLEVLSNTYFSNAPVKNYNANHGAGVPLFIWDDDRGDYVFVPQILESTSVSDRNYLGFLGGSTEDGDQVETYTRIPCDVIDPAPPYAVNPEYCDVDRDTTLRAGSFVSSEPEDFTIETQLLDVHDIDFSKYDELYIGVDTYIGMNNFSSGQVAFEVKYYDLHGVRSDHANAGHLDMSVTHPDSPGVYSVNFNFLPNAFYTGGNIPFLDQSSEFDDSQAVRDKVKVPPTFKAILDSGIVAAIEVKLIYKTEGAFPTDIEYSVKEFGLYGALPYTPQSIEDCYTSVQGEPLTDGSITDNVYTAFRYLLEEHDGIAPADIDYTNVAANRSDWIVGRQFTEKKNSRGYLEDLARQSFVGIYPDRLGRRRLRCWLEDVDFSSIVHSDFSQILQGSIDEMRETAVDYVYNDYYVKYAFDPGAEDYLKGIMLTKTWQGSYTPNCVSGVDDATEAESLWDRGRAAYLRTQQINPPPDNMQKLDFFTDRAAYNPDITESDQDRAAFKYLSLLVMWASHTKNEIQYDIPLTANNIQNVELLEPVSFSDTILTNGATREGWFTKVEYDLIDMRMRVKVLLKHPDASLFTEARVSESGSAETLIDESGARSTQIDETGFA